MPAAHNTAILLDTDSVFHGVDRVAEGPAPLPPLRIGMRLTYEEATGGAWVEQDETVVRYDWDDLRFSVSWKAYCFRRRGRAGAPVQEHTRRSDPRAGHGRPPRRPAARGRLEGDMPGGTDLALLLIDEYVRFPAAAA